MLVNKLKHILPEDKIKRYENYFATLIFFEKQAESFGWGEVAEKSANSTLKNLSEMTAAFEHDKNIADAPFFGYPTLK